MTSWEERRRARAEVVAEVQESEKARTTILAGVDSALARVADTIAGQTRRIAEEPFFQAQRDMDAFVVAADQLKAISTVLGDLGADVDPLRDAFESATPHIRTARDVFAHYEDYLLGVGQWQERRGEPVSMYYQRGNAAGTAVHMTNPDVVVDIGTALDAAANFADGLTELVIASRVRNQPSNSAVDEAVEEGE